MPAWLTSLWRTATMTPPPGQGWYERHPLPADWRARTRIDVSGVEVEPWLFLVLDRRGWEYDAGERWLATGYDPDHAAYEILDRWLGTKAPGGDRGLRCVARRAGSDGDRVGVAYEPEQAIIA